MFEKPNIRKIWKDLKTNKEIATSLAEEELKTVQSEKIWREKLKLPEGQKAFEAWSIYNEPLYGFEVTLEGSLPLDYQNLPRTQRLIRYIEDTLSSNNTMDRNLTAIEFGGPGSKLFESFSPNFFKKTIGITLGDWRSEAEAENDTKNNHTIIVDDFVNPRNTKLYKVIEKNLTTDKTDLIISRMEGGLNGLAKNLVILNIIMRKWYSMLNENGIIFVQFESGNNDTELKNRLIRDIKKWADAVSKISEKIEIQIDPTKCTLRLHKKSGAPIELPSSI